MHRIFGPALVFFGAMLVVLSISGVLPQLQGLGISVIVLGVILAGLSFVSVAADDSERMPAFERLTKIFYSPAAVFRSLRAHPEWVLAVLVIGLFTGVYEHTFVNRITAERIAAHQALRQTESQNFTPEKVEENRKQSIVEHTDPVARAGSFVAGFVGRSLITLILGLVILLLVKLLSGGIGYWQAVSVAAYSMLPTIVIGRLISTVLLFVIDPATIHPVFGTSGLVPNSFNFLVSPMDSPGNYRMISYFSLFGFYWLWLVVVGIRNAGSEVSMRTAWIAGVVLWLLGFALVAVPSLIG